MISVFISVIGEEIEVSEEGRFQLPSDRDYSAAELKKIASEINKESRKILARLNED